MAVWGAASAVLLFPCGAMAQVQTTRDLTVPSFATGGTADSTVNPAALALTDDPIYDFNLQQGLPYAPPRVAPRSAYNLKLGSAYVTFSAVLATSYTDNALQAPDGGDRQYDVTITPTLGASISWRPRENQGLRFDVGVGYRYSLQFSELNTLTLAPNSFLDYQFSIGDVTVTLFNSTSTPVGPRPEVVGQNNDPTSMDFNRIDNTLGVRAAWSPYQDMSISGGYSYALNRGFDDAFSSQNLDQHSVNLGTFFRAHPQLTFGVSGGYTMMRFVEPIQNDMDTVSVGPVVSYSPTANLSISAQVGYTIVDAKQTGTVVDSSDFSGMTYGGSIGHRINKYLNHSVSGGFSVQPGVGANYSENYNLTYSLTAQVMQDLGVSASFNWTSFEQSSGGLYLVPVVVNGVVVLVPAQLNVSQKADFYSMSVGTGYQITTKLNATVAYIYTLRASENALEEFDAHSANLTLTYRF